jgi:signal transduction histidine kinase
MLAQVIVGFPKKSPFGAHCQGAVTGQDIDYAELFAAIPSPCLVMTPDLIVVGVNQAYLDVTGREREDLLGRDVFDAFPGPPADSDAVQLLNSSLHRVLDTAQRDAMAVKYDIPVGGRPGAFEQRYWSVINAPVLSSDGAVMLVVHRAEDVTAFVWGRRPEEPRYDQAGDGLYERERAMEAELYARAKELEQLNEQLRQANAREREVALALQRAMQQLQEAVEHQRQFSSDVSHDLRGPITAMRAEVEDALLAPGDTTVRAMGGSLLANVDRLQAIIEDVLAIARLDAAEPGACDPVDLADLVTGELADRHPSTKQIEVDLQQGNVVMGDWLRLCRLLTNLVNNAERHADSVITITVRRAPGGQGDPRFAAGTAILEVLDDGPGIPLDECERVFQRFARLRDAQEKDPGGTGLGLAIARQIAEMSGGTLTIADSMRGARFVLRLPLAP